jgi:Zn-dependent hydrolases, including glyoxylases
MNSVSSNADLMLHDGDTLELGDLKLEIMHTPGHTKGSMCILVNEIMFSGDTLFAGSMGRTDLYSGDSDRMKASLKN